MKKLLSLMLLGVSLAGIAGDKGNGGNTVDVNGIPRLRDLVDNTTCDWRSGEYMLQINPVLGQVLKNLNAVDWYFAADLESEIKRLNYCLTGKLMKIDTEDYDGFITRYHRKSQQVAIRLNSTVFIDENLMNLMPVYDQAFLMIHESMHSYIPQDTSMRNMKVRTSVRAIEYVHIGYITTSEDFHLQLKESSVYFPQSSEVLNRKREEIYYLMGSYETKRSILLSLLSVERFLKSIEEINDFHLASWHVRSKKEATLDRIVNMAIQNEDEVLLKHLLRQISIRNVVVNIIYGTESFKKNEFVQNLLKELGTIEDLVRENLKNIPSYVVETKEGRIHISAIEVLTATRDQDIAFNSLITLNKNSFSKLDPRMKTFLQFLADLIEKGDHTALRDLVYMNTDFYRVFSSISMTEAIKTSTGPGYLFDLEKEVSLRKVPLIFKGFWELAKVEIEAKVGKEKYSQFKKQINQRQLGYRL